MLALPAGHVGIARRCGACFFALSERARRARGASCAGEAPTVKNAIPGCVQPPGADVRAFSRGH
eukprot:8581498-Pyramimonas_sp.AAC.1